MCKNAIQCSPDHVAGFCGKEKEAKEGEGRVGTTWGRLLPVGGKNNSETAAD